MKESKELRVRVPKDKEELINNLTGSGNIEGPFSLIAEVMTFSAALGFKKRKRVPFEDSSEPIRQSVFNNRGYDIVINLIAIADTGNPRAIGHNEEEEKSRIEIFEEYANGGLEFLRRELIGQVDTLQHLLLLIKHEKIEEDDELNGLDLSNLI